MSQRNMLSAVSSKGSDAATAIPRRSLLQAGLFGLGALALPAIIRASNNLDPDDPESLLRALVKLRGSLDDSLVVWWMKGVRYGVMDDTLKPLFNMLTGGFQTYRAVPGEGFEVRMLEVGYFTDLETGEPLDTFRNPYTGAELEVPEQRLGPYPLMLTTNGVQLSEGTGIGDIELQSSIGPAIIEGDDIWIREDAIAKVDSDHPMMGKHTYNELVTYHGRLSQIDNPALNSVPATVTYQSVTSWREWFQMKDMGGHTTARAAGRKVSSVEEMPADYLAIARERHPQIIRDPGAALGGIVPAEE